MPTRDVIYHVGEKMANRTHLRRGHTEGTSGQTRDSVRGTREASLGKNNTGFDKSDISNGINGTESERISKSNGRIHSRSEAINDRTSYNATSLGATTTDPEEGLMPDDDVIKKLEGYAHTLENQSNMLCEIVIQLDNVKDTILEETRILREARGIKDGE